MSGVIAALLFLAQCPMCKEAMEGDQQATGDSGMARGFADSIYLMVATPYVLLGAGIWLVWRSTRKQPPPTPEP